MTSQENTHPTEPTLDGLTTLLTASNADVATVRKIPPLEKWSPNFCGDMNLTIKANGEWWHEGRKMTRQSLVDLFSSVLWAESKGTEEKDGETEYFLKTPVEKLKIQVEDAPLIITQVEQLEKDGKTYLEFRTPHGDSVIADDQHPIFFQTAKNTLPDSPPQPYILVRQNGDSKLYGLIHRNVFYHLISMGELSDNGTDTCLTLKSGDSVFELSVPNVSVPNE